jgi:hypothetical protein
MEFFSSKLMLAAQIITIGINNTNLLISIQIHFSGF